MNIRKKLICLYFLFTAFALSGCSLIQNAFEQPKEMLELVKEIFIGSDSGDAEDQEKMLETYNEVDSGLEKLWASDAFQNLSAEAERAEAVIDVLQDLSTEEQIKKDTIEYDKEEHMITFTFSDGGYGGVVLDEPIPGTAQGEKNTGETHSSGGWSSPDLRWMYGEYITDRDADGNITSIHPGNERFIDVEAPYMEGKISAKIIYGLGPSYESELEYCNNIKTIWEASHMHTEILEDSTVLELREVLTDKESGKAPNLLVIDYHGRLYKKKPILGLREFRTPAIDLPSNEYKKYSKDIQEQRVVLLWQPNFENKDTDSYLSKQYCVLPEFFRHYYKKSLNDSIVFICSCYGYANEELVSAFADCGAKAVIGFSRSVWCGYARNILFAFTYSLLYGNDVEKSLEFAESIWGNDDEEYRVRYILERKKKDEIARPRIYNGHKETLVTLTEEAKGAINAYISPKKVPEVSMSIQDTERTKDIPSLYKPVLDMFCEGISNGWNAQDDNGSSDPLDPDSVTYLWKRMTETTLNDAGYLLTDLNEDGTPELIIATFNSAEIGYLYELYTIYENKVVHLVSLINQTHDYFLLGHNNHIIYHHSAGATVQGYTAYRIENGELEEAEFLGRNIEEYTYRSESGEKETIITAQQFKELSESRMNGIQFPIVSFAEYLQKSESAANESKALPSFDSSDSTVEAVNRRALADYKAALLDSSWNSSGVPAKRFCLLDIDQNGIYEIALESESGWKNSGTDSAEWRDLEGSILYYNDNNQLEKWEYGGVECLDSADYKSASILLTHLRGKNIQTVEKFSHNEGFNQLACWFPPYLDEKEAEEYYESYLSGMNTVVFVEANEANIKTYLGGDGQPTSGSGYLSVPQNIIWEDDKTLSDPDGYGAAGLMVSWDPVPFAEGYEYEFAMVGEYINYIKDGRCNTEHESIYFQDYENVLLQVRAYRTAPNGDTVYGPWTETILDEKEVGKIISENSNGDSYVPVLSG